jgi:hypothetical protein
MGSEKAAEEDIRLCWDCRREKVLRRVAMSGSAK